MTQADTHMPSIDTNMSSRHYMPMASTIVPDRPGSRVPMPQPSHLSAAVPSRQPIEAMPSTVRYASPDRTPVAFTADHRTPVASAAFSKPPLPPPAGPPSEAPRKQHRLQAHGNILLQRACTDWFQSVDASSSDARRAQCYDSPTWTASCTTAQCRCRNPGGLG